MVSETSSAKLFFGGDAPGDGMVAALLNQRIVIAIAVYAPVESDGLLTSPLRSRHDPLRGFAAITPTFLWPTRLALVSAPHRPLRRNTLLLC